MSAEFEAQILADLRRTHAQLKKTPPSSTPAQGNGVHGWSMRLTVEEVDLLLKIVDERDDLKRRLLSDWEPDFPETKKEAAERTLSKLDADLAALPPVIGYVSCPFVDTIHDCPLGGCPDASPREVQIPDLTMDVVRELPGEAVAALVGREASARLAPKHPAGREARETPPRPRSAPSGPAARDAAYDAMRVEGLTPERCSTCGDPAYRSQGRVWHWGTVFKDHGATL